MELNEMIMVMGTPAQVAASRMTVRRPRLSRGPSSMWGRAAVPELPPGCVQLPHNQPCPTGWVDKTLPGPEPVRVCCPATGPLAGPCPEGYKLVPPYYDAWGNPKCEKKGDRPLAVPTDTRGRNAHLSRSFPGRQLASNPVDWSRESALVRTSSPHMKANPAARAANPCVDCGRTHCCGPNMTVSQCCRLRIAPVRRRRRPKSFLTRLFGAR